MFSSAVSEATVASAPPAHRWRVLGLGVAANGSFAAALSGLPTTAITMRSAYHLDNGDLGLIFAAMGLGLMVSELPWGLVTDRLGDRRVLLTGLAGTGLVLALLAVIAGPDSPLATRAVLACGLLLLGLVGGSLNGASGRAVMAWFGRAEQGLAMSIRQMALPAGGALGALLLPVTASHYGFAAVFGLLSALCWIAGVFAVFWLHEPPAHPVLPAAGARIAAVVTAHPLTSRQVWRMVAGLGCLCMPQIAVITFATIFLHDAGHFTPLMVSGSLIAVQLGAAVTRVWSGHFTDHRGDRRSFLKALALITAGLFAGLAGLVVGDHLLPAAFLLVLGGIMASTWHGVAFAELATIAGPRHVATALGLGNSFAFGAYFVTPLIIPALLPVIGWSGIWSVVGGCALLAGLLFPGAGASAR